MCSQHPPAQVAFKSICQFQPVSAAACHTVKLSVSNSLTGGKTTVRITCSLGGRLEYELGGCKLLLASCLTIGIFEARKQTFVHYSKQLCL